MKKVLAGLVLSLVATVGQSQKPDSLLSSLLARPDDTVKVILLNKYSTSIRESNNNEALRVAETAKSIAEKLHYRRALGPILENIGWIIYRKGNFAKALIYGNEGLKIYLEFNDKRGFASCSNNISAILVEQNRFEESIQVLRKALRYAHESKDLSIVARCCVNIALGFLPRHQFDSAQYYTEEAIKYGEKANDQYRVAFGKRTLGDIYLEKGDITRAREEFFKALLPTDKGGNAFLETSTLYRIAKTYFLSKEYDKALQYLERNKVISEKFEFKTELERMYLMMSDIYRIKNDKGHALYYQDKYLAVHDSLLIQRSNEQMALKQAKYEADIQQAQIDLLKKDALLKEEELNIHQVWNYIFITGLFILAVSGAILFYGKRRMKKFNAELQESNQKIKEQAIQLRELNATKDKIFSIIGHDLRSPLASLRGLMGLVNNSSLTQEEFVHFSRN